MLTQKYLKSLLRFEPDTGLFRWKVSRPPRAKVGAIAGHENGSGYIKLSIGGRDYYAHRLAFLWMTGKTPPEVDHINHCRSDNRWANLRPVNRSMNCANVAGRKGVRFRHGRWYARFSDSHLGVFDTMADAMAARRDALCRSAGLDPDAAREAVPRITRKREHRSTLFEGKTLSEWSRITGIPQTTLHQRICKRGWTLERATADRRTK